MMEDMTLPGMGRLLAVCQRAGANAHITPPSRMPPKAGRMVGGHPLDPELAAFYTRCGGARFASDVYLLRVDDEEDQLEEKAEWWREDWQGRLGMPLFIFGGVVSLAYYFALAPSLMDAQGRQPVVLVDTYSLDGPALLPLASSVSSASTTRSPRRQLFLPIGFDLQNAFTSS